MIQFKNWTISALCGEVIARQYDNLSRTLTVMGDLPSGWDWSMLVESGGNLNIISLSPVDGGVGVTLTADMIPYAGYYRMQLRGTQGEAVRHTNILTQVYIPPSLTGEGQWPDLPSEFEQIEERMQELAGQAQDSADAADTSAKAAAGSATAAQESAAAAAGSSSSASGSAQTAQTAAQNAQKSAEKAQEARQGAQAAQQAIEDLEVSSETLEPDSPASVEKTVSPEGVVTLEFGIPRGPQGQPGADAPQINDAIITDANPWSSLKIVDTLCPPFSVSGNPVTCHPVEGYPLSAVVTLKPKQAGSGDPSPENVRPISGYDNVQVTRCGKNLLDPLYTTIYSSDIYWGKDSTGIRVVKGKTYALSNDKNLICSGIYVRSKDTGNTIFFNYSKASLTFTPSDTENVYFHLYSANVFEDPVELMLELGSAPTDYEPYQGNTYDMALPETVYGGSVDAVTGVGEKTWGYIASYNGESLPGEWISDRDVYTSETTPTTGAQVAYKLATPIPFTVTPHELNAVAGTNTIYSSTGDTSVSGRADPNTILQQLAQRIAALEEQAING